VKHSKLLAVALLAVRPKAGDIEAGEQWVRDCLSIAAICLSVNPRFDRDQFFGECGCEQWITIRPEQKPRTDGRCKGETVPDLPR
jgi:hypothetical protein